MITLHCTACPETFTAGRISEAMEARRQHMHARHIEAKIETDT